MSGSHHERAMDMLQWGGGGGVCRQCLPLVYACKIKKVKEGKYLLGSQVHPTYLFMLQQWDRSD